MCMYVCMYVRLFMWVYVYMYTGMYVIGVGVAIGMGIGIRIDIGIGIRIDIRSHFGSSRSPTLGFSPPSFRSALPAAMASRANSRSRSRASVRRVPQVEQKEMTRAKGLPKPEPDTVFISTRFGRPELLRKCRALQKELRACQVRAKIVRASQGIQTAVMRDMESSTAFLAMGSHDYGEDTKRCDSNTAFESLYWENNLAGVEGRLPIIRVRMIPMEQAHDFPRGRAVFSRHFIQSFWLEARQGDTPPVQVLEDILHALGSHTPDPATAVLGGTREDQFDRYLFITIGGVGVGRVGRVGRMGILGRVGKSEENKRGGD